MISRRFDVIARDKNLALLDQIPLYSSLQAVPRHNDIGTWSLSYPVGSKAVSLLKADGGVMIRRQGSTVPVLTGPVTNINDGYVSGQRVRTFSGVCDNVWLADKRCWPVPTHDLSDQGTSGYDYRSGDVETIIRGYVQANAGTSALAGRNTVVVHLEAANGHHGAATAYSARFDVLLEVLQKLAEPANLGFRVVQESTQLVLHVFVPTDRSAVVAFSQRSGTLAGHSYNLTAPSATRAIVGDSGAGVGRVFDLFTNSGAETDWNRVIETFADQRSDASTTIAQINQAGADALNQGSPTAQVTFTAQDMGRLSYGIDYGLGDKVTVEIDSYISVVDVVREVNITDSRSGLSWSPTIGNLGSQDASVTPVVYKSLRWLGRRIGALERNL